MSDSETPQHNPERDNAPASSAGGPANGAPQPAQSPSPTACEPQSADGNSQASMAPSSRGLGRVKHLAQGRKGLWAAVAVLCVAVGAIGSVLGARAVARSDAANAGQAFPRTSAGIARTSTGIVSALKLAIQHEEDLVISASTFFAGHLKASAAEFTTWVKWAQALHRY